MTWPEAVDEALCFGWIDGVRHSIDETSYRNRFTPRRRGSNWSKVNIAKVEALIEQGRMRPPGLEAFEARTDARSGVYSFEQERPAELAAGVRGDAARRRRGVGRLVGPPAVLPAAGRALGHERQAPGDPRARLAKLIESSGQGRTVPPLTRPGDR